MNWVKQLAKMAGLCVMAGLLMGDSARSQELPHLSTIADCPPGYRLAVQDTPDLMLPARQSDPNAGYVQNNQEAVAQAQQQATAPRQFVTGCVPPQSAQQQYGGVQ